MRTTLNIDDDLLEQASQLSGLREKTAVVREGLRALIERESALRLAKLSATEPQVESIPRRRRSVESVISTPFGFQHALDVARHQLTESFDRADLQDAKVLLPELAN